MTGAATATSTREGVSLTRVEVVRPDGGGRVSVRLSASGPVERPVVRAILVGSDEHHAAVSLVPDGALLLAGDAVSLDIRVGPGARLELLEPAGTVAYPMAGGQARSSGQARWDVRIALAPAATLIWAGEPFVIAQGACVVRRTTVSMAWGARLALREVVVLGRHGEGPGHLRQELDVTGPDAVPVLRESLTLGPDSSRLLIGGARVISTVLLLGDRLPDAGDGTRLDLDFAGTMVRGLAREAHLAEPATSWATARKLALECGPGMVAGSIWAGTHNRDECPCRSD